MNSISAQEILFSPWEAIAKFPHMEFTEKNPKLAFVVERVIAFASGMIFDSAHALFHAGAVVLIIGLRVIRILPPGAKLAKLLNVNLSFKSIKKHSYRAVAYTFLAIPITGGLASLANPKLMLDTHIEKNLIPDYTKILKLASTIAANFKALSAKAEEKHTVIENLQTRITIESQEVSTRLTATLAKESLGKVQATFALIESNMKDFPNFDVRILTTHASDLDHKRITDLDTLSHATQSKITHLRREVESIQSAAKEALRASEAVVRTKNDAEEKIHNEEALRLKKIEEARAQEEEKKKKLELERQQQIEQERIKQEQIAKLKEEGTKAKVALRLQSTPLTAEPEPDSLFAVSEGDLFDEQTTDVSSGKVTVAPLDESDSDSDSDFHSTTGTPEVTDDESESEEPIEEPSEEPTNWLNKLRGFWPW